jgi:hypothetical protein
VRRKYRLKRRRVQRYQGGGSHYQRYRRYLKRQRR